MSKGFVRHPKNAVGPFYVVDGECIACGAPELAADGLMSHDEARGSQCFFVRQPETTEEVDHALRAVWSSCCGAVRYGGKDAEIITKLSTLRCYDRCDERLMPEPSQVIRSCVLFTYLDPDPDTTARKRLTRLMEVLIDKLVVDDVRCIRSNARWSAGSFQLQWGVTDWQFVVQFEVGHVSDQRWSVRVRRDDATPVIGWVLRLHDAIRDDVAFPDIEWFNEPGGVIVGDGATAPY